MTDRITKERVKELREWAIELQGVAIKHAEKMGKKLDDRHAAIFSDLLALLDQPAPPTGGGEVERARMVLDAAIDLAYAYDLAEKDISDAYNEAKTALRYLLSILSAPKTVTREWLYDFVRFIYGHYEAGIAIPIADKLRELGITVEDKSEGEDD